MTVRLPCPGYDRRLTAQARSRVKVEPLTLSSGLMHSAQIQASRLAVLDKGLPSSSQGLVHGEGENVTVIYSPRPTLPMTRASRHWAREAAEWKNGRFSTWDMHLHGYYTQVIRLMIECCAPLTALKMYWSATTRMGIASARARSGTTYTVARYYPAGYRRHQEPVPSDSEVALPVKSPMWQKLFGSARQAWNRAPQQKHSIVPIPALYRDSFSTFGSCQHHRHPCIRSLSTPRRAVIRSSHPPDYYRRARALDFRA